MTDLLDALKSLYSYSIETPDTSKERNIVFSGDGVYQVLINKTGKFTIKIGDVKIPGLKNSIKQGVELAIGKIPDTVYTDLLAFYREVYKKIKSEVHCSVFYNPENNKFFYYVPKQQVSTASIEVDKDEIERIERMKERYILILDTHSHGGIGAGWSGVDDREAKEFGIINLVIGSVNSPNPTYRMRIKHGDISYDMQLSDIFQGEKTSFKSELFQDWDKKVTEKVFTPVQYEKQNTTYMGYSKFVDRNNYNPNADTEQTYQDWIKNWTKGEAPASKEEVSQKDEEFYIEQFNKSGRLNVGM